MKFNLITSIIFLNIGSLIGEKRANEARELLGEKTLQINTTQDSVISLSNHWVEQALSALFATVAHEKIKNVPHFETKFHEKCLKDVEDIQDHAKCVTELLKISRGIRNRKNGIEKMVETMRTMGEGKQWIGAFRMRKKRQDSSRNNDHGLAFFVCGNFLGHCFGARFLSFYVVLEHLKKIFGMSMGYIFIMGTFIESTIVNREKYSLKTSMDQSPFTMIAKQITKSVRTLKNKKEQRGWRQIIVDIKKQGEVMENQKKIREMLGKSVNSRSIQNKRLRKMDDVIDPRRPLANSIDNEEDIEINSKILKNEEKPNNLNMDELFQKYQDHPESVLNDSEMPKMLNMSENERESVLRIKLIRDSVKMGLSLGGQNVSGFDRKSLKFASPRFFAIAPEEYKKDNDTINILSPSLFSLHDEGSDVEKKLSLSNIFDNKIINGGGEKDAWMDLLTEVTGISDTVDEATEKVRKQSEGILMNSNGEEVSVTKENLTRIYGDENYRKMKVLEKINGMYTDEQLHHFNKSGYAIMTEKQREMLYGSGAPFENQKTIEASKNLTMKKAKKALYTTIKEIGNGNIKLEKYSKRMKDIVASPIVFSSIIASPAIASQALILSPVLFTPLVLSPSIYGAVILSPWVFIPVILSPRIFAPIIVSPAIFSPIVLSPLALDPLILVPGIANPIVLSPFLMTPFILSPQVMTPIILSPFALSPFILTPSALSPLILSPFVLSPTILSPSFVTAVILSPYALSPSILSPPTMISVFASPSILS